MRLIDSLINGININNYYYKWNLNKKYYYFIILLDYINL
jgi:hypothetical protein